MISGFCRSAVLPLPLLALVAAARAQNPPTQPPPEVLRIRVEADHVTAEIRSSPLRHVLEELAARTGIVFEVATAWNPLISLTLYKVPLQEAVQRVVGGGDSIFYFAKDAAGVSRIRRVRALLGTGVPTKSGDDAVDTVERALKAVTEHPNVEVRQKAVEVLATVKGDAAVSALTLALADKSPEVRAAAIEGLAGMGARPALPKVLATLKDSHPGVRQSAVEAVTLLGTAENVKDLKPLVRDKDPAVASAAEMGIRRLLQRP
ncbi:MAG: hypothetical protein DMG07_09270 [Acidobacteria bacterium]|nr:MAG: hypothetical protein DMG07_09270 [Acidobacteriota bacterium]